MFFWNGIINKDEHGIIQAWISNFTTDSIQLKEAFEIATWTPTQLQDIMFADSLATKPLPVISASEHIAACLAIDAKANPLQHTVEWEWDDEHMSA